MGIAKRIGVGIAAAFIGAAALSGCGEALHDAAAPQGNNTQTSQLPATQLDNIKTVNKSNFETEVLKSSKPVMVYFYAEGCHFCQQTAPSVKELSHEKADGVKFVKVDARASWKLAKQYNVSGTPTFFMFRDGNPISRIPGAASKEDIAKWIDDSLALPGGTKLDLTQKRLSNDDKQRLRDAFESAVNKSPDADVSFAAPDGSQTTLRKAVKHDLDSGVIFQQAEMALNSGTTTINQLVEQAQTSTFTVPANQAPRP